MKYWLIRILLAVSTFALVVLGFFFLTIALVIGGALAVVFGVRLWWALRRLKRAGVYPTQASHQDTQDSEPALDGEYQVVERESTATRLPSKKSSKKSPKKINSTPPAP